MTHLAFIEGYLLGVDAPQRVLQVLDALMAHCGRANERTESTALKEQPSGNPPPKIEEPPSPEPPPEPKPRKRAIWTEERRLAQAERMRAARWNREPAASEPTAPVPEKPKQKLKPSGSRSKRAMSWGWNGYRPADPVPIGETTSYIDDAGRKITKYPPGYAHGISPTQTVMPKGGAA